MKLFRSKSKEYRHPATIMSFRKLYKGLMKRVDAGYINVQRSDDLEIFSYSKSCMFDGAWDKFTLMARGLILDPQGKRIIALTFPKFFNWGEVSTQLPNLPFTVLEKMDGSLGIIFYWRGKWQVATKGSFQSEQAVWATDHMSDYNLLSMNPDITYLTEIIAPWNKIVVSYSFEDLVLLSGYHLGSGIELTRDEIESEGYKIGFPVVKEEYYDSLDDMLKIAETLDVNHEGFVVRFSNGYRIKIKGAEYIKYHKLYSCFSEKSLWEHYKSKDTFNMGNLKFIYPEEFWDDINSITCKLKLDYDKIVKQIEHWLDFFKKFSQKDVGLYQKSNSDCPKFVYSFVFASKNMNKLLDEMLKDNKFREIIFKKIKPKEENSHELGNII